MSDSQTTRDNDPDETEGRKLYRDSANSLATAQISMASRRAMIKEPCGECHLQAGETCDMCGARNA